MSGAGNVYLLRHGTSHWYKIGRTINSAAKRICTGLATGNPEGLTEVASWYCELRHGDFETQLHALFQPYHLTGRAATEFFDFTDVYTEAELVARITREHDNFTTDVIPDQTMAQATEIMKPCNEQIEALLRERRALTAQMKLAELRIKSIDNLFKQYIAEDAGFVDQEVRPAITWKTQSRQVLDTAALRQDQPELAAKYTKTCDSRVFRML
jgi:hypothetical protein